MRISANVLSGQLFKVDLPSPVGPLTLVASDFGLRAVLWPQDLQDTGTQTKLATMAYSPDHPVLVQASTELWEYFRGRRTTFSVPLELVGTPFQRKSWTVMAQVPYGGTASYTDLAERLGHVRLCRAVGGATGKNPLSIVLPCHRIIGKQGSLTGFAGGLKTKSFLLNLEKGEDCGL